MSIGSNRIGLVLIIIHHTAVQKKFENPSTLYYRIIGSNWCRNLVPETHSHVQFCSYPIRSDPILIFLSRNWPSQDCAVSYSRLEKKQASYFQSNFVSKATNARSCPSVTVGVCICQTRSLYFCNFSSEYRKRCDIISCPWTLGKDNQYDLFDVVLCSVCRLLFVSEQMPSDYRRQTIDSIAEIGGFVLSQRLRLSLHCTGSLVASFAKRFRTCINILPCPQCSRPTVVVELPTEPF